jgi:hypothetical protein
MKHVLYFALFAISSACVRIPVAPPMANEVEYYKQMYGQAAATASSSNAISWSALGLIATIAIGIVAVQFIFNFNVHKAEIKAIKDSVNGLVVVETTRAQQAAIAAISAASEANTTRLDARVQELERQLRDTILREIASNKEALNARFNSAPLYTTTVSPNPPSSKQLELNILIGDLVGTLSKKGDTSVADIKLRSLIDLLNELREVDKPTYRRMVGLRGELIVRDDLGHISSTIRTDFENALSIVGIYNFDYPDFNKKIYERDPPSQ